MVNPKFTLHRIKNQFFTNMSITTNLLLTLASQFLFIGKKMQAEKLSTMNNSRHNKLNTKKSICLFFIRMIH